MNRRGVVKPAFPHSQAHTVTQSARMGCRCSIFSTRASIQRVRTPTDLGPNYSKTLLHHLYIDSPTAKIKILLPDHMRDASVCPWSHTEEAEWRRMGEWSGELDAQSGKDIAARTRSFLLNPCFWTCYIGDAGWMCRRKGFLRAPNQILRASGPTDKTCSGCSEGEG